MSVYEKLSNPIALSVFVFTLFLPVIVGFLTVKKTKNQSDFFVGGMGMNKFVVALSAVSSGRSSWLVLGVSGMAYKMGVGAVWAVVGYVLVELFQFIYLGKKLRNFAEKHNSLTILDYFESRFNDKSHLIRITGSIIILVFITAYVAAQLNAGAVSLSTALNIPLIYALCGSLLLILVYMVLGGYVAVAYNDVVRAIIMIFGLVIFPVYGLYKLGGVSVLLETVKALNPNLINPYSLGFGVIIGFLGIGLGSPGQPHIVVRYISIDNPDKLRNSAVIGTFWNIVLGWGAVFIGLLGKAIIPDISNLPDSNPEMVYLVLSSKYFGPVLYGLLVGGIFAAILSTADSQLLVVASTFVRDIYEQVIKKGQVIEEKIKLRLSRIVVIVSGILAAILAYIAKDLIFWLVLFAWGGLGASLGTSLIFSIYYKKTTKIAVVSGMITGTLITIIWKLYLKTVTGVYELIPAFFIASIVIFVISKFSYKNENFK